MKTKLIFPVFIILISVLLLSGCGSFGIAKQDEVATIQGELATIQGEFTIAKSKIESLEKQISVLSTINAYNVWFDQYYARGTYKFTNVTSFNSKLGSLIQAIGTDTAGEPWKKYLVEDKSVSDIIQTLPEDTKTWNTEQYDSWYKASSARYAALGELGTALFNSIAQ